MPTPGAALDLLARARASLIASGRCDDAAQRYVDAHLGALRAAAALVAARSVPRSPSRPRSVWQLLAELAPELGEWAAFFAASARRRAAVERGAALHGSREADDLVRAAETFLGLVEDLLGVARSAPLPGYTVPAAVGASGSRRG